MTTSYDLQSGTSQVLCKGFCGLAKEGFKIASRPQYTLKAALDLRALAAWGSRACLSHWTTQMKPRIFEHVLQSCRMRQSTYEKCASSYLLLRFTITCYN